MIDFLTNFGDALLALEHFDACGITVVLTAGLLTCGSGSLFHELGHFVPARAYSGAGKLVLFPFRHRGDMLGWLVAFAIDVPDDNFRALTPFQAGVVIAAGPAADIVFTFICAVVLPLAAGPVAVGLALGAVARVLAWFFNVIPIPAAGNDGAQFLAFVWKRAS